MGCMKRVNKANPCPACGKDSWCLYDEFRCLCMRAESKYQSTLKSGEIGWWHQIKDAPKNWKPPEKLPPEKKIDAEGMMDYWRRRKESRELWDLAESLGMGPCFGGMDALFQMRIAWAASYKAWAWPMRDGMGNICGIRLRASDGKKWSVTGSKSGIFLPWCAPQKRVWICEGGTDAAALLSLNCYAIGRPSCSGGTDEINATIKRLGIREAVIIADNDEDKTIGGRTYNPGADGAKRLSERLIIPNCVITLPCKDAREFLALKGDASMLESLTQNCLWRNP